MSASSLVSRASIPLIVCALGAVTAATMLSRPAPQATEAAVPAAAAPAGAAPQASATAQINIAGFAFDADVVVSPGQAITVSNADGAPHTLTSADGLFDTGQLDGGATGSVIAPEVAGTYSFICTIHPSMTGSVTVTS